MGVDERGESPPRSTSAATERYQQVRDDPARSLSEFWELSADHGEELSAVGAFVDAEDVLGLAADSLRERPHPADLAVSLRIVRGLAEVRGQLGHWRDQRDTLEVERRLLEHAAAGTASDAWRDLGLRLAAADLAADRFDPGFDHLAVALLGATDGDDDAWFERVVLELSLAAVAYASNRLLLVSLETALSRVRTRRQDQERGLRREVQLGAAIALAHLSRDATEVAGIYEQRIAGLASRLADPPVLVRWASSAVALASEDIARAAAGYSSLVGDVAQGSLQVEPGLRFQLLAGLGETRWSQGDRISARGALGEAESIGTVDRRRLARVHELLAELARRDHRLDEAFRHLQSTRCLEDDFRARAGALAEDRSIPLPAAMAERGLTVDHDEADTPVVVLEDRELVLENGRVVLGNDSAALEGRELEQRVESLESNLDARTRELEQALIDLRDMADRSQLDPLTGLASRQHLTDVLNELIGAPSPGAVIAIDLDRFGRINETLGHEAGDAVLAEVAQRLRRSVRPRDTLARWGGDEFMVLLPGLRDLAAATAAAEVVRTAITATLRIGDDEIVPSASIGVAVAGDSMADPAALLRAADTALERAKARGKGRVEVFGDELADDARRRFDTEAALRHALDHDGFELHYQPVHPNRPDEPLAAEALLRIRDPQTGALLSPGSFLDVAEETGLARPIGDWVLDAACAAAATWSRTGVPFHLAVNVSASQLDPEFPDRVAGILARHRVSPSTLVIELTEHSLLEADDAQVAALVELRSTGVRIALDDFGTAYSSLSHLRRFPVDVVKIDRSFVAGICRNERDHAIVRAVVDLSQTFRFRVIAEGVETTEQLDQQRRLGCHGAQGFLIGRPKPAAAFAELLSTRFMFEALSARSA